MTNAETTRSQCDPIFSGMLLVFDVAYSLLSTCQPAGTSAAKYVGLETNCTALGGIIPWLSGVALHPVHRFLEAYEHSLIAGFTIVLGVSTILLWISTRDAARGAERAANIAERTLTDLERPWIFVQLAPFLENRPDAELPNDDSGEIPLAVFEIANHGRMPAIIDGCWIELGGVQITAEGPQIQEGLLRDEFHGAIGPGRRKKHLRIDCPAGREYGVAVDIVTGASNPVPIILKNEFFVFYIFIQYLDIAKNVHISSFCWRFDTGMNYWVQFGGNKYNHQD